MNTYEVLKAEYSHSHAHVPLRLYGMPPPQPIEIFSISWHVVGAVKETTVERAIAQAKRLGWRMPVVQLAPPPKVAAVPQGRLDQRYARQGQFEEVAA